MTWFGQYGRSLGVWFQPPGIGSVFMAGIMILLDVPAAWMTMGDNNGRLHVSDG